MRRLFKTHVLIYYFDGDTEKISYDFVPFQNVMEFKNDPNYKKIKLVSLEKLKNNQTELRSFQIGWGLAFVQIFIMDRKARMGKPFVFYETMTLRSNLFLERDRVTLNYNLWGGDERYKREKSNGQSQQGKKRVIVCILTDNDLY